MLIATGEAADERQVAFDQLLAGVRIALLTRTHK
jgi:hypothetical protein